MARRCPDGQVAAAEFYPVAMGERPVDPIGATVRRQRDLATGVSSQQPPPRDMIRMDVGFQGIQKLEAKLVQQRAVAPDLFIDRVDQHRRARLGIRQKICVGARLRIE